MRSRAPFSLSINCRLWKFLSWRSTGAPFSSAGQYVRAALYVYHPLHSSHACRWSICGLSCNVPIIPNKGFSALEPLSRPDVRMNIDRAEMLGRPGKGDKLAQSQSVVGRCYNITRYLTQPVRHRVTHLSVLLSGSAAEFPRIWKLLNTCILLKCQCPNRCRVA